MTLSERSQSTRKGIIIERLVREALGAYKAECDIHTPLGGFELRWGPTTKNGAGLAADRLRARQFGGCCVQVEGIVGRAYRDEGDIPLSELLDRHGVEQPIACAFALRDAALREAAGFGWDSAQMSIEFPWTEAVEDE